MYRKEVYLQIQEANKEAVNVDGFEALKQIAGIIYQEEKTAARVKIYHRDGSFFNVRSGQGS